MTLQSLRKGSKRIDLTAIKQLLSQQRSLYLLQMYDYQSPIVQRTHVPLCAQPKVYQHLNER